MKKIYIETTTDRHTLYTTCLVKSNISCEKQTLKFLVQIKKKINRDEMFYFYNIKLKEIVQN